MDKLEFLKPIIKHMKIVEGGYLHMNKGELDITNGYGIYRHVHPQAEVFEYIDSVAKSLGITKPSKQWSKEELKLIDSKLDPEKELELSTKFYTGFFGRVDVTRLPGKLAYAYINIYINSPTIANKGLQDSTNNLIKHYDLKAGHTDLAVDGKIGQKSLEVIYDIVHLPGCDNEVKNGWLFLFLIKVQSEYIKIATDGGKEDKHLQFLRGWENRVRDILEITV